MPLTIINGPIIAAGQSLSSSIDSRTGRLARIMTPAGWTPANVSFQISNDDIAYYNVFHWGEELIAPCGANRCTILAADLAVSDGYLKIRSGSAAYPVIQTTQRDFITVIET